jgi:RNA polymerase sigma-70 factor (ECF subfamily)
MGAWGSESGRPEGGVVRAESNLVAKDALQRALMGLSLDQREVMVLFHQLDWPIWLIAEHLGMPEGTVKSHLHRGRRRLREVLAAKTVVTTEQTLEEAWL